jgi:hypothetical protein
MKKPIKVFPILLISILALIPMVALATTVKEAPAEEVQQYGNNLLVNPGFDEGPPYSRQYTELRVYPGWEPFWVEGGAGDICEPNLNQRHCNPPGTQLKRPEYKPHDNPWFGQGETAQQWFCWGKPCEAGIYQTFNTVPGQWCEVGARIGDYSSEEWDGESDDEFDESLWYLKVDPRGGGNAFNPSNLSTGYQTGFYDEIKVFKMTFQATSSRATFFIGNKRRFSILYQDSIVYDAYAYCGAGVGPLQPTLTPFPTWRVTPGVHDMTPGLVNTPIPTFDPNASPTPIPSGPGGDSVALSGALSFLYPTRIRDCSGVAAGFNRSDPVEDCRVTGAFPTAGLANVVLFAKDVDGNIWAWHRSDGSQVSVVCYEGRNLARFYRGLTTTDVERVYAGLAPVSPRFTNPCSLEF